MSIETLFIGTFNVVCKHKDDCHNLYTHDVDGIGRILVVYSEPFEAERKAAALGDGYIHHTMTTGEDVVDLLLDARNMGITNVALDPGVKGSQSGFYGIDKALRAFSDKSNYQP